MNKILLTLALCCLSASVAYADKPAPPPFHHKHHKKHKKVVVIAPPVVIQKEPDPVTPPPVVVLPPPPVVVVAKPVVVPPPVVPCVDTPCPEYELQPMIPSAHIAVGVGAQAPWSSGLLGLRLDFPKAHLGLEPFVSIPYGVGVDGMVYAYRGPVVQFYPLSVGFMVNWNYNRSAGAFGSNNKFLSDQDINRVIDLRLGAGIAVKLACHVSLSLDWRVSIPDPVKLSHDDGVCHNCGTHGPRALDAGASVGNAFAQSQILIGLLFR